jgi:drug/metabolite transporter (DMT)-like permease
MIINYILLTIGIIACSTAVIFVKLSGENFYYLSVWRLSLAAILLMPIFLKDYRKYPDAFSWQIYKTLLWPSFALAIHFLSWLYAIELTSVANASLIVNFVPVVMPFFLYVMLKEKTNMWEFLGTAIAIFGLWILCRDKFQISIASAIGEIICFLSMLTVTWYFALARKNNKKKQSIFLYVVPIYANAALICLAIALIMGKQPKMVFNAKEILIVIGLAIIPTIIGHSILTHSMKILPSQVVTLLISNTIYLCRIIGLLDPWRNTRYNVFCR